VKHAILKAMLVVATVDILAVEAAAEQQRMDI